MRYETLLFGTGDGLANADGCRELDANDSLHKPGKFPHLAGCKVLAVPELPFQQVGKCLYAFWPYALLLACFF